MSDSDSLDYLQTGFDPSSLTVPRLRSILVSHDIAYPSGAKKPQLVEIFTDNVLPRSRKILSARARARRTSRGITDADSQDSTVGLDDEEDLMPPPPTPRARSSRKASSRYKSEEEEDVPQPARSPTKRTPRASSKHARAEESETGTDLDGGRKSVRRSRKSEAPIPVAATPAIKIEERDEGRGASRRESAFTYDNPFQSGSSPPSGIGSGETKRKSLGGSSKTPRKSSSSNRRRTDGLQADDGIHPPTSSTFEIPVSRLNGLKDVDDNGVEASEEFTPEAQLEMMREEAANGRTVVAPPRPRRRPNSGFSLKGPLWVAVLTLLGGYSAWYRQEKVAVGYCGVGRETTQVIPAGVQVPDWVRILAEPECEPCPQHAYCYSGFEAQCEPDFVMKAHPLSLGGVVPVAPTCEPDGAKARKVKSVADKAITELRERRAKFECGDLTDEAGLPEPTVEINAEDLKKEMSRQRKKTMGDAEFEDLWAGALGEITARDEVVSTADG